MNNLVKASVMFVRRNGSTILTWVVAIGVVTTAVATADATIKATKRVEQAKQEKGEDLTKAEVVKAAAPAYIPAVVSGATTIACMFGANVLSKRQQAALISGYALLENSYKEYKKKVDEMYGEDASEKVEEEIVKDHHEEIDNLPKNNLRLYYDSFSMRYFEASIETVRLAEYNLNRDLSMRDYVYLNEWYDYLGLEHIDTGFEYGWSTPMNFDMYWQTWIDFHHERTVLDDGLEVIVIDFFTEPQIGFEDY